MTPNEMQEEIDRLRRQSERERAARFEAEAIAERVTRELYDERGKLVLLQETAVAANQAKSSEEAVQFVLTNICRFTGWPVAHAYFFSEKEQALVPTKLWYFRNSERVFEFRAVTENTTFRSGVGLPGRVLASRQPTWIQDLTQDDNFQRAKMTSDIGLRSAFAFPILVNGNVTGVLEFFSDRKQEPDVQLSQTMSYIGAQLGQLMERQLVRVELQRSEEYFRRLTENSLDLITILNADGKIRYESQSIEETLGYPSVEYVGKNAFEFVHPEDLAFVQKAFVDALEAQGDTPVLTFRFRHRDGSWRTLEGRGNNLLNDPIVQGIVFNSRDVTERKRLEEQFLQSQKVQAVGQLAGGVAHDFNNLLTAIINYNDIILRDLLPNSSSYAHALEIGKAAERATSLTRQLLAFSRKQILQPRVIDLNEVVMDMDKMLRRLLGETVDLVSSPSRYLGAVKADPGQIQQVIMNIVVNARDAMPGGGKLTVETRNVTLDDEYVRSRPEMNAGEYVLLAISDSGTGMPAEVKAHLFEPFFTTKEMGKGTGLGLATCHGIVKQSGGHISVYSEIDQGTTFKIYLPRVAETPEALRPANTSKVPTRGNETILFVEDEPMLREVGELVLTELGYKVLLAENGQDALRVLAQHTGSGRAIDLLLTDIVMPEMGGKELAGEMAIRSPATKVIFMSGYTDDAIVHSGVLEPGVSFLQKPYTIVALAQKVREMLDN